MATYRYYIAKYLSAEDKIYTYTTEDRFSERTKEFKTAIKNFLPAAGIYVLHPESYS